MDKNKTTRIDKWLCAVRIYGTRSLASKACTSGKVKIDGGKIKSSRIVRVGDIIQVRKDIINFEYKILNIAEKRMGAKLVPDYMMNITAKDELEKSIISKILRSSRRDKRKGRPTKKERRKIDKIRDKY